MENHQSPKDRLSATQTLPTPSTCAATDTTTTSSPNSSNSDAPGSFPVDELDLLLPKVCEALVLVVQCLTSLTLQEEDKKGKEAETIRLSASPVKTLNPKGYIVNAQSHSADDVGFIEALLGELLFCSFWFTNSMTPAAASFKFSIR